MTGRLASDIPRYRRLHLSLRPARVAVLVQGSDDWMPLVLRIIEGFSRVWGGAGNILVPVLPGEVLPEYFWPVLARFDPDRLGYLQPTLRAWQMADAVGFDAWLADQARQWVARRGGTLDEARMLLTGDHHLMHSATEEVVFSDDLRARIRARLAPLGHGEHLEEASFEADQPPGRLCWRRRIRLGGVALRRAYMSAQGEDPGAPPAYAKDDFLGHTPLGDTMRGCDWFLRDQMAWKQRPFFVVCGDQAADFCLALALDRCYGDAAWFPQSFVHGDDEVAAVARSTLALIVDGLRGQAEGRRPTVVTSATLPTSELTEAAQVLLRQAVDDDRASIAEPARLPLDKPWRLLDREQFDRTSSQPFVAFELAGELPLLRPSAARSKDQWACTWQVDVAIDGYQLPARHALSSHLVPEQDPWTLLRSSTDGISCFPTAWGSWRPGPAWSRRWRARGCAYRRRERSSMRCSPRPGCGARIPPLAATRRPPSTCGAALSRWPPIFSGLPPTACSTPTCA
jgi:hypothetical protein